MGRCSRLLVVVPCAALAGLVAARAQQPAAAPPPTVQLAPSAPNVPDKIPFDVPYGMPITLARAKGLIGAAEEEAKRRGWKINIAVVDPSGDLLAFERMDGAQLPSVTISQNKARTAARWRRETRVFFKQFDAGKAYYATLDPQLAASPGGLPIIEDGHVVGGIGCSGGTSDQDEIVCKAGLATLK